MSQQILYSLFLSNFAQLQFSPPLLLAISLLSAISINSLRIFNSYSCSSYSLSIPLLDINHYIEYLIKFFIHSFFLIVHGINLLPILFLLSLYIHLFQSIHFVFSTHTLTVLILYFPTSLLYIFLSYFLRKLTLDSWNEKFVLY